jgi:tetratricopeptide (TPR) repeat protein
MVAQRRKIESVKGSNVQRWWKVWAVLAASAALTACAVPSPYEKPAPPPQQQPPPGTPPAETRPGESPSTTPEPTPPPAPVIREPTLGPASRALVSQAQTQMASKNYVVAASSIERALRIEPDNPLLWIELGKIRFAEGNYVQSENMARKAVSMSVNAPRAQSSAWRLIAESYRARGKNPEAQQAQARADSLSTG